VLEEQKRYKLIACEILFRELCYCCVHTTNLIDITFLPKGLHDIGSQKMSSKLQEEIDKVQIEYYDAILLGYALCNNGIVGLSSETKLVVPKAHDCITLLMGSKNKYKEYHSNNSGAYYKSTGWIERHTNLIGLGESIPQQLGMTSNYDEYVKKYGEDNAKYIMEMTGDWMQHYNKLTFIDIPIANFDEYKELTKKEAQEKGWKYEEIAGDIRLLQNLIDGNWCEDDFLVLEPNQKIKALYNDNIICSEQM